MKFWMLKWKAFAGYDSYDAFIIAAPTEAEARAIAQKNGADEVNYSADSWLKPKCADCRELKAVNFTAPKKILGSFNAG